MGDLAKVLERAVGAARRGDVTMLEVELSSLRRLPVYGSGSIATVLRGMARSSRLHPARGGNSAVKAS